jgi:uncharacterized protein
MWIIELEFTDAVERLDARPAHRERLTELHRAGTVKLAGPLADQTGAVIVVDLPDREAVARLLAADPYFTTPGVTVGRVRQWEPFLT